AFWTASIERVRIVLIASVWTSVVIGERTLACGSDQGACEVYSNSHVSPSCATVPSPPNRTSCGPSAIIPAPARPGGGNPATLIGRHTVPSSSHESAYQTPLSLPPNSTSRPRDGSNASAARARAGIGAVAV